MIKKIIFLSLLFIALLGACSKKSDDSPVAQQSNYIIKKVIESNEFSNNNYIQYFNDNGTLQKDLSFLFNQTEEGRGYRLYEYDTEQRLTAIKLYSGSDEFIRTEQSYSYNAQGQLVSRVDYGDATHPPYNTTFTYMDNRIDFIETETNRSGYFVFDINGRIMETSHDSGGGIFRYYFLSYENGQLMEIRIGNQIYTYSIDENPNPLFRNFISNPIQYLLERHFLYDIDFTSESYLFPNNVTNVTRNSGVGSTNYRTTTFQFNNSNFAISSSTLRSDGAIIDRTYEYY